ncbi:hypothetical protein ACTQ4P_05430 [Clostridium sporogenes]|uniref:hypothetical protein n=1 Tax=Clostridium sporogenes TaxID=1509 RepID=UPI0029022A9B|nr:hypothetical protein [Clostridium botulinum]
MSLNSKYYCVWCGETFKNKEEFKEHYKKEIKEYDDSLEENYIFELINNENNY